MFGAIYAALWLNDFNIAYTQAFFLASAISGVYLSIFVEASGL